MADQQKPTSSPLRDFCRRHCIAISSFYELEAKGLAPRTVKIGKRRVVTDQDEAEWLDELRRKADRGAGQ